MEHRLSAIDKKAAGLLYNKGHNCNKFTKW